MIFSAPILQRNGPKMVKLPVHRAGSFTARKRADKAGLAGCASGLTIFYFFWASFTRSASMVAMIFDSLSIHLANSSPSM
jgi:hypothetical protein